VIILIKLSLQTQKEVIVMTPNEFRVIFEMIADVYIPDELQRSAVEAYCLDHFDEIERMQEVYELSNYIQRVREKIETGTAGMDALLVMISPVFIIGIRLPTKKLTEEIAERITRIADDIPEFLLQFFADRGIDIVELDGGSREEIKKFERIIRSLDLNKPHSPDDVEDN
jgi:hypothetical protein